MLNYITIKNIVLIDQLTIEMAPGLCVLTGETGSGKSILLDALGLAIGQRSNSRLLGKHGKQGVVVAEFDISKNVICQKTLQDNGLFNNENPNLLQLRRILYDNGSSKAFINDIPVGVNLLNQIGNLLIEIHGQHDQRGLLTPSSHKIILDQYSEAQNLIKEINQSYDNWQEINKKLDELKANYDQNQKEIDYLNYIIAELENADIYVGEEESLVEKRNLLTNQEKITNLSTELNTEIKDASTKIYQAQKTLLRNQDLGEIFGEELRNKIQNAVEITDQIIVRNDELSEIIDQISNISNCDESLEEIEQRLFLIKNLSRKFNVNCDELSDFLQKSQDKLAAIENYQSSNENLEKSLDQAWEKYLQKAQELSKIRQKSGQKMSEAVKNELTYLKMGNVNFVAKIEELKPENYNRDGIDSVRFMASTNQNSDLDNITKIASGGELSRFMLALKVALLGVKSVPILIFDEIDSGIGGSTADAVGKRLKLLSEQAQIMVVTHHPQVAAKGNHHLRVHKTHNQNNTKTIVDILDKTQSTSEIARMLSGETTTKEASAAAKKLMTG